MKGSSARQAVLLNIRKRKIQQQLASVIGPLISRNMHMVLPLKKRKQKSTKFATCANRCRPKLPHQTTRPHDVMGVAQFLGQFSLTCISTVRSLLTLYFGRERVWVIYSRFSRNTWGCLKVPICSYLVYQQCIFCTCEIEGNFFFFFPVFC